MTTSDESKEDPSAKPDLAKILERRKSTPKWVWIAGAAVVLLVGIFAWRRSKAASAPPPFLFGRISRGQVVERIEATGAVQALLQVQVGAQVNGRIQRLHADFNSQVHQGELIAEIDPTAYRAQVDHETAALQSAEDTLTHAHADLALAENNFARAAELHVHGQNAPADYDTARDARDGARAQVAAATAMVAEARATLVTAQTNLQFTDIFSPIDGIVISRNVDVGQTVASSLQAPVLFVIANDLPRMQVVADVDEADIGRVHDGLAADVHVDAFPGQRFTGAVTQIRYQSTTTSGVVTYPVVVDVANADLHLRPGMTATVRITTDQRQGVLRVPNAALRYQPSSVRSTTVAEMGATASDDEDDTTPAASAPALAGVGHVYVLRNGAPTALTVHVGLSDGTVTEVEGAGLQAGQQVIVDDTADSPAPRAGGSGGGGPGGGGMRRML